MPVISASKDEIFNSALKTICSRRKYQANLKKPISLYDKMENSTERLFTGASLHRDVCSHILYLMEFRNLLPCKFDTWELSNVNILLMNTDYVSYTWMARMRHGCIFTLTDTHGCKFHELLLLRVLVHTTTFVWCYVVTTSYNNATYNLLVHAGYFHIRRILRHPIAPVTLRHISYQPAVA